MRSFEDSLVSASAGWVREGLITADQRSAILQRHPVAADGGSRFIGIVATLGGVLFAVGVSLVIKANWQALGDWVKIGGLVALLVAAYATGWTLKLHRPHLARTGDAALMVGQILFLCGIALVSQIFHLNDRPATGVLWWWLGIVAVPWLTRAKGAQFVSLVAGVVWLGMEMTTRDSWLWAGRQAVASGHGLVTFFLVGVALWMAGVALRGTRWSDFAGLHEKWGLALAFAALFFLGFVRHSYTWTHGAPPEAWRSVVLGAGLAAVAVAGVWRRHREEARALGPWLLVVPLVAALALLPSTDPGWTLCVAAWSALAVLSIGVVRVGLVTGREGWVNLGILALAANIVARYFDFFGTLLEGGVFFIVSGVVVTTLGIFLERKRRSLLATLRKEVAS